MKLITAYSFVPNLAMSEPILTQRVKQGLEETKVEYVNLGNSGLRISVPILGCMSYGHKDWLPWILSEWQANPILKAAFDRGLNTWDTANMYSNGISEEIIGRFIQGYCIPRHKLVLLTKCYGVVGEEPGLQNFLLNKELQNSKDYVNQPGLSRKAIFEAVNGSLKRLGTDYIDLFQIHRFDYNTPIAETMEALHDIVKSGKVRYIGASSMYATQFARMQAVAEINGWTKFISMQNHYSLLYREEEREMNRYCNDTGVGLIPWSPLARGNLARPLSESGNTDRARHSSQTKLMNFEFTDADKKIITEVENIASAKGWTMSQVSLAWIKKRVSSPIVGISSIEKMDEILGIKGKELSDEDEKTLEDPYVPKNIIGHQ